MGAPLVAIVDETAARRFWPGRDPIGQLVGWPWANEWRAVVGVVGAVRNNDLAAPIEPAVYVPFAQSPSAGMTLVARTTLDPITLGTDLRRVVAELDAEVPVSEVRPVEALLADSLGRERLILLLLGTFAATALLLGAIGLYGVTAYDVGQRTGEIGVRLALGATSGAVLRQVLGRGLTLALVGTGAGLATAAGLSQLLEDLLHGVGTTDPLILVVVPAALIIVALVATAIPARRAARVEPMQAMRGE